MTSYQLHLGDCVEWLRTIDDESVALCVTDPAYESLEKHRAKGTTTRLKVSDGSSNEWFAIFRNRRFPELLAELYRVLAKDSHLYVLCDQETAFDVVKPMGVAAGFTWWKALVWEKTREAAKEGDVDGPGPSAGMGYHYRAAFEHVCFLEKGKRRLNDLGVCDVIRAPRVRNAYPTEKPVSLLRVLVEQSSSPGQLVIDPFNGSGSCGEASLRAGRLYAGADVSEKALALSTHRLAPLGRPGAVLRARRPKAQGSLFGALEPGDEGDHQNRANRAESPTNVGDEPIGGSPVRGVEPGANQGESASDACAREGAG